MSTKGESWSSSLIYATWADNVFSLDDLNEVVNFHFEISRASIKCPACDGSGYAPDAHQVSEDYYDFANTGRRWNDKITLEEAQALVDGGRLRVWNPETRQWDSRGTIDEETLAIVNFANSRASHQDYAWAQFLRSRTFKTLPDRSLLRDLNHDGINRGILVEARCRRLGYEITCPKCEGHGYEYTEPHARVGIVLWFLHPRKGASRGVEVTSITQEEVPEVIAYLREARDRFLNNFKGLDL